MRSKSDPPSAERFSQVRSAHRTELAEDYVELILEEIERTGEARLTKIAARLGVAHPTVSKFVRKLEREGYVSIQRYKAIELTDLGRELALSCRERHRIVVEFLLALGLDSVTAEHDAEGIEHHVSPKTLELMRSEAKRLAR